jgi:hypothetical protein
MSTAFGVDTGTLAGAIYDLESGASNLSTTIRKDLVKSGMEFSKLTGTDLPTSMRVINKAFQIYKDDLGDVATAQNKLFAIGERGYIEPETR